MGNSPAETPCEFQSIILNPAEFNYTALIEEKLTEALSDSRGTIRALCFHIMEAGGKRIRPLLVFSCGLFFGDFSEDLIQAAVAVELIHMASLVHDDLIDETGFRRSKPTAQMIWGNQQAVLGGDYLFAKAFRILAERQLSEPLQIMARTVQTMCQGEIEQDNDQFNIESGMERYYSRITQKTAVLLEASCQIGALVSGARPQQIEEIGRFGLNLGLAYQMIDDVLDLCGDSLKMGKPKYADLIRGNITLPLLLLMQHAEYGGWLKDILSRRPLSESRYQEIETAIRDSGILTESFSRCTMHLNAARDIIDKFPESLERRFLMDLIDKLRARAN